MHKAWLEGRQDWVYYIDGFGWQRSRDKIVNGMWKGYNKRKLVPLEEYEDYPTYAEKIEKVDTTIEFRIS